jgi:uncharacterized protein YdhG (YjbR/CyaY superfamily)
MAGRAHRPRRAVARQEQKQVRKGHERYALDEKARHREIRACVQKIVWDNIIGASETAIPEAPENNMARTKTKAKTADEYLAAVPMPARGALEKLRQAVKSVVADATEGIGYGIVVFKYKGKGLVGLGATENHCAFYVMSTSIIPAHKEMLKSYDAAGGTIRFPADKPLSVSLVRTLVMARIVENEALRKKK